jgi:hypothetical protein
MKIRRWNGNFVITIPKLDEPKPSKSGKSILVATSGIRKSKLKVDGHSILYVANVFFYPAARPVSASAKERGKKRAAPSRMSRKPPAEVDGRRRKVRDLVGSQKGPTQLTKSQRRTDE